MAVPLAARDVRGRIADASVASSALNVGQQIGASIGVAGLGTAAWTVAANRLGHHRGASPDAYTGALTAGVVLLALLIALLRKGGQLVGRGHGPGSHPDPPRPSDPGHGVQPGWHPASQLQRRGDDPAMGHGYRPGTALGRTDSPVG
jgi:hypothetical protein